MTLNCDIGEGVQNEVLLLDFIDRASIACGGHTGDQETVMESLRNALRKEVACGAHPSYPDQKNFGRKPLSINPIKLRDTICRQLELFLKSCHILSYEIDHIKAHGALYNDMMFDLHLAENVLRAVEDMGISCSIFALYGSAFYSEFKSDFKIVQEAFVDRRYASETQLASRSIKGAVITSMEEAVAQYHAFQKHKTITTIHNKDITLKPDTVCIHGDNPNALDILKAIKQA